MTCGKKLVSRWGIPVRVSESVYMYSYGNRHYAFVSKCESNVLLGIIIAAIRYSCSFHVPLASR